MSEEEEVEEKENLDLTEDQQDTRELLVAMKPQLSEDGGEKKLLIDWHGAEKKLSEIKRRNEICILSNGLLDLTVQLSSRKKNLDEVQKMAHESMKWMMDTMPTHRPLGVN